MFANSARVLLVLPQDLLDRARVIAGRTTTALKLPVSVQIVLRALIGQGLARDGDRGLLRDIAAQAEAVRRSRSSARRQAGAPRERHTQPRSQRRPSARASRRRGR